MQFSTPFLSRLNPLSRLRRQLPRRGELNSLSQNLTVLPAPSKREPLARPQALRFSRELYRYANGPILEGAVERSETGGVCSRRAREQQLFLVWKTAIFPVFSTRKNGGGPVLKTWGQPFQIGEK